MVVKTANFIKTDDPETVKKLKALGYQVFSFTGGVTTFLNDPSKKLNFSKDDHVLFSDKIEM